MTLTEDHTQAIARRVNDMCPVGTWFVDAVQVCRLMDDEELEWLLPGPQCWFPHTRNLAAVAVYKERCEETKRRLQAKLDAIVGIAQAERIEIDAHV